MDSTCSGITSNADVSGIGIRVNLYATTLLLAIIPKIPGFTTPLIEALSANAGISGAALIITAIIKTAQGQLSLYHAIFIVHMLFFLGLTMSPSGRYPPTRALLPRIILTGSLTYVMMLMYTGWSLFVWATAETFGPSPHCNNEVKYIFFFRSVRATAKWLRGLWMAGLGGGALVLVIVPMLLMTCWCCRTKGPLMGSEEQVAQINWSLPLAAIYDVVMLELYVKRNRDLIQANDEQDWTFGQIIALVMILSSLNEVLHFLIHLYYMVAGPRGEDCTEIQGDPGVMMDVESGQNGNSGQHLEIEEKMKVKKVEISLIPAWLNNRWGGSGKKEKYEEEMHDGLERKCQPSP